MSEEKVQPIVIKKKVIHAGHHGGAWKIAFADFMTAMMAFFLVMWLLSTATEEELKSIADYFSQPIDSVLTGRGLNTAGRESPIPGGGEDPSRTEGDMQRAQDMIMNTAELEETILQNVRADLTEAILDNKDLKGKTDQVKFEMTPDGLLIQIVDTKEDSMFQSGKAVLSEQMNELMKVLAPILSDIDYRISLSGHTDSVPYSSGELGYSNWELSADRANATRRALVKYGLKPGKLMRVMGMADSVHMNPEDGKDPKNRRIAITVLNRQAQYRIMNASKFSKTLKPEDWIPAKVRQER